MKNLYPNANSKILIRGVDTVWTFILATPFYRELRKNFSEAHITLCIKPLVYDLVKNCPYIDEVIVYDKKKYGGEFSFIKELRKRKFDAVFILSGSFRSALICYLAAIKNRIGYAHDRRGFLLTHKIPDNDKHCVEYILNILEYIGEKVVSRELELWFSESDFSKGEELLKSFGIEPNDEIVGVGFGVAGEKARQWPTENWIMLIKKILKNNNIKVILFGTKNDFGESIVIEKGVDNERNERLINLVDKTNLIAFASYIKKCALYVSVDTGGIHIASALGVPVVGLYVPGSDARWGPRGKNDKVIAKKVFCAPCDQHKMRHCKDNICMKNITVEEVCKKVGIIWT